MLIGQRKCPLNQDSFTDWLFVGFDNLEQKEKCHVYSGKYLYCHLYIYIPQSIR